MQQIQKIAQLLILTLVSLPSLATIVTGGVTSGNGDFVELSIPFNDSNPDNTVGIDTFQNDNLYGFNEDQNIILPSILSVDLLATTGLSGELTSNTVVASHYIFFDPVNTINQEGFVDFDADILAVIFSTDNLSASDFLLNNNVTYLNPSDRGLEGVDEVSVDGTLANRLLVDWRAATPGDYIRVLTALSPGAGDPTAPDGIPEPASILIFGLGALMLYLRRR
ncbi:PEP-CTERM sorting domain-containing protein [uncultured Paraglaciecola sp.]|uniref:PEP-CTERM sorting domain-containing protein n=1 Tax=uncultured Paraglaciecola sp. TaxID=1765024 RepID=UPI0026032AE8|nr:PEP-CTERM sorting domain-containing protein [uncultured Paraglaciecola sp.]